MIIKVAAAVILAVLSVFSGLFVSAIMSGEKFQFKPKRFLILSALNITVWVLCLFTHKKTPVTVLFLCLGFCVLLCVIWEDINSKKISDIYLIALLITAILFTLLDRFTPWYLHLLGCAVGYLPLFLIRAVGESVKKQEVLGIGDVYLSGILGLMLGLYNFLLCGMIACVSALCGIRILRRKKQFDKMHTYPFSPFLFIGYTLTILFGDLLTAKYTAIIAELFC